MTLRYVATATIVALLAPAAWLFGSGLYVGLVAPGTDRSEKLEARYVLWRDVVRARSRQGEIASLGRAPTPIGRSPGLLASDYRVGDLSKGLSTCSDYVIEAEKPATDWVFRAGTIPVLFPQRSALEEDAASVARAHRFSIAEMAFLHACFRATPFGVQCGDWIARETPSRNEVLSLMAERGWVAQRAGSYCWQLPEFRLPS